MNVELINFEFRRMEARLGRVFYLMGVFFGCWGGGRIWNWVCFAYLGRGRIGHFREVQI